MALWVAPAAYVISGLVHESLLDSYARHAPRCDMMFVSVALPACTAGLACLAAVLAPRGRVGPSDGRRWVFACLLAGTILCFSSAASLRALAFIDYRTRLMLRSVKPLTSAVVAKLCCGRGVRAHKWVAAVGTSAAAVAYVVIPGTRATATEGAERFFAGALLVMLGSVGDVSAGIIEHDQLSDKAGLSPVAVAGAVNCVRLLVGAPMAAVASTATCHPTIPLRFLALSSSAGALAQIAFFCSLAEIGPVSQATLGAARKLLALAISGVRYGPSPSGAQLVAAAMACTAQIASGPCTSAIGRAWARRHGYLPLTVPV